MKRALLVALVLGAPAMAQDFTIKYTDIKTLLKNYHKATKDDLYAPLKNVAEPKVADLMDVADRALKKGGDIQTLRNTFDNKIVALLSNDVGRWIATDDNAVRVFIGFELNSIESSDAATESRLLRVKTTRLVLESHRGPFTISDNNAAKMLLLDATWIENTHQQLNTRLNLIASYENRFPQGGLDGLSEFPTLGEVKTGTVSRLVAQIIGAQVEGRDNARKESVDEYRGQAYSAEMLKIMEDLKGKKELAELTRQYIEAEYEVKLAEKANEVQQQKDKERQIRQSTLLSQENEAKRRLHKYLSSPAVRNLLAPFAGDGRTTPRCHRNRHPIFDPNQLEPGPMSYASIHKEVLASSLGQARQMDYLTAVANDPENDRPAAWGISNEGWRDAGKTFKNIDGKLVNKYVEAYKILRDHGTDLVELGILRP